MVGWSVSWPQPHTSRTHLRNGDAPDRDAAISAVITTGRRVATTGPDRLGVGIDTTLTHVSGFADPQVSDGQLRQRIEAALAAEEERAAQPVPPPPRRAVPHHATPAGSVGQQWGRVASWLAANTRGAPPAGAPTGQIDAAEAATGVVWPAELKELYTLVNSFPRHSWVQLLPQHDLLDLDDLIETRARSLRIWNEPATDLPAYQLEPTPLAGQEAGTFLPQFLPFAGGDGYRLFVDTRPGPLTGCVTEFGKYDADESGPRWHTVSAMLTDLADSLENQAPFDNGAVPSLENGHLVWDYPQTNT